LHPSRQELKKYILLLLFTDNKYVMLIEHAVYPHIYEKTRTTTNFNLDLENRLKIFRVTKSR